jgi:hypothetical protein
MGSNPIPSTILEFVMIKMIIAFLSLFVIIFTSADIFRRLTGKEKMKMLTLAGYSAVVTIITAIIVITAVGLF